MSTATMSWLKSTMLDKKTEIVAFSSTAIALYGYDQGMMSLINTNEDYLKTMGIGEEDPLVGVIVSVYYLGTAVGAILASYLADRRGRKPSIFVCLATTSLGNLIMFLCGLGFTRGAMPMMFLGRIVMGLGVGGIDAVIPVYSSELNSDGGRGKALAQEFQSNIFGLNMAFAINLFITIALGKANQWCKYCPLSSMMDCIDQIQHGEYLSRLCKFIQYYYLPLYTGCQKRLDGLSRKRRKRMLMRRLLISMVKTTPRRNSMVSSLPTKRSPVSQSATEI